MSNLSGVVREGWLKRIKNQKKRYFVLGFNKETGDAQLQYYENPKKFSSETVPKRVISLQKCLGIVKKCDEKFGNILALYSKEAIFRLKADTDELLEDWFTDINKLHQMEYKNQQELKYDMVWKVKVISRGLGGLKNVTGSYKLCLKENTLYFVNPVSQAVAIEEKLYHVRRFGYWDNCVFMEFGRSTALGPGEIWMEVDDPLIAQKIEDSLSRSAKPKNSNRKSLGEDPRTVITGEHPNNNNETPKSRRKTFAFLHGMNKKGKGSPSSDGRAHCNSMSASVSSAEEQFAFNKDGKLPQKAPSAGDDEDSEDRHYPKITPPVPSAPRTKSQSSGSLGEDNIIHRKKEIVDLESKHERVRGEGNNDAPVRSKQRSKRKQNMKDVRQRFAEEYQSASLPRRTSSSSSSDPSWRRSAGSENLSGYNYNSDKECDIEDGEAFLQHSEPQYVIMNRRPLPRGSDSSVDEPLINDRSGFDPGTYVPLKPPTGETYIVMNPNGAKAEKMHRGSFDSHQSPEDGSKGKNSSESAYVNMKPGPRHITSSSSSDDFLGDERFDHLNRGESRLPSEYVNMAPQSARKLKKSNSQTQRNSDNAYMNVDVSRSKSVGSKSPRFRIVSEQNSAASKEENQELMSSYVNVKAKDACPDEANYANFAPVNSMQDTEKSPAVSRRELNYASVEFPTDSPRISPRRANSQDNYSKIDFEKSHVLADISITRERQLHHL